MQNKSRYSNAERISDKMAAIKTKNKTSQKLDTLKRIFNYTLLFPS